MVTKFQNYKNESTYASPAIISRDAAARINKFNQRRGNLVLAAFGRQGTSQNYPINSKQGHAYKIDTKYQSERKEQTRTH